MEKGQILEVKIEDMSSEGQGIGKADGFAVFVPSAVIGDVVRVKLTKVKKNYGFSRIEEVVEESPYRSGEFDCDSFDEGCGGCQYGGLEYGAQLVLKARQVGDKLRRIAKIESPVVRDIIGMSAEDNGGNGCFRYRNKAQFSVSAGGIITKKGGIVENLGKPTVGFFHAGSRDVADGCSCLIQSAAAVAAAAALQRFMEEDNITAWDPRWKKGLMRRMVVKTGFESGEVMVILEINGKGIPNVQKLIGMLDDAVYDVGYSLESVVLNDKRRDGSDKMQVVAGRASINDSLGHLSFEISPESFYQVNPVQMKRLYDKVREYCEFEAYGQRKPVILDLYCGVGSIGLYCADSAEYIVGIESVQQAVLDANRNAVINGIVNARYICGKAEAILPAYVDYGLDADDKDEKNEAAERLEKLPDIDDELAEMIRSADIVILDPPRAGCRPELLEAAVRTGAGKIVYVSCNPATLARDVKLLGEMGYEFKEATPVDMFPHTSGIEAVAKLIRRS